MPKKPVIKNAKMVKEPKKVEKSKIEKQEEIEYFKTIICAIAVILLVVGGYFIYQYKQNKTKTETKQTEKITYTNDEIKFKKEYESLNESYTKVSIIDDNNIKYISLSEAVEILKSKTGVIFFGYAKSNDSRIAAQSLLKAMSSTTLDEIYYVDIENVRDEYEPNLRGNAGVVSKKADTEYYELLDILKKYLPNYEITNQNGKTINVGEKRLVDPTVVTVRDGKIFECLPGVKAAEELTAKYLDMISNYLSDSCPVDEPGDC